MTRVDLHPEELFDRARRGIASPQEAQRLRAHVEICRACRFEHALFTDCAEGAATWAGDQLVLARVRHATIRALDRRLCDRSGFIRRSSRLRITLLAAAALVVFGAVTAAGATFARRTWRLTFERKVEVPVLPAQAEAPKAVVAARAPGDVERSPTLDPPLPSPAPVEASPRAAARHAALPDRAKPAEAPTAAELFTRANRARRGGDPNEALRIYRELQTSFPGSPEELLSRVVIGRLLLDRLGDARGALAQFDGYLANSWHASLREEALVGRALALGRLGRHAEEKTTWAALLAGYPNSASAERARARMAELP